MANKFFVLIILLVIGLAFSAEAAQIKTSTLSQRFANINYPITKLGNCESKQDCKVYCDQASHMDACLDFAEENFLLPQNQIDSGRLAAKAVKAVGTPGNCKSRELCLDYCSKNFDACLTYMTKAGFISSYWQKLFGYLKTGGPGGCKVGPDCDAYCAKPDHQQECLDWSVKEGLMDQNDMLMMTGRFREIPKDQRGLLGLPSSIRGKVESCLKAKIGSERFSQLIDSPNAETASEQKALTDCL
ncbi:MAG: hypothetical protein NTV48_01215, partial [Candidatus Vogelbacteria bacterium]|nr:hypothetical protein [Candidatus Vogelbacteria bacterium]